MVVLAGYSSANGMTLLVKLLRAGGGSEEGMGRGRGGRLKTTSSDESKDPPVKEKCVQSDGAVPMTMA